MPAGLLQAIGRVESGRRDPVTGQFGPWPWTINAEGRGMFFPTREAAIAEVRQLQARGVRLIDVGCMQVNLYHHPNAFPGLDQAFDPLTNARYAAQFLSELQASTQDWARAAGHYHSQTPERAEPYRARVLQAWAGEQGRPPGDPAAEAALLARFAAGGSGPLSLANRAERAQVIPLAPGAAGQGRGLDAYRAAPIMAIGRVAPAPQPVRNSPAPSRVLFFRRPM
ncbi:transglycosylase SLT domain-containing protein [Roseomonas sp. HJA6]|uniref:Transglycosylase SLT domain-containing protein n=1 Tax=Roseomonas alba TaxID=2846776 RepID=A0ABS7A913_9PROT|nr:transglycosylase SLT domain-containing protein [Neoroseomonas alba]